MTSIRDQYRIIAEGAGHADRPDRGRLVFEGRDAASFLQALVSNDVVSLMPGRGVDATYLTPQGRMIADLRIRRRAASVVVDVPAEQAAALAGRFDGLIFSEDVRVADETAATAHLVVFGGRAAETTARALGMSAPLLEALPVLGHLDMAGGFVARTADVALPGFEIVVAADACEKVVTALEASGSLPLSEALVEALRIDAGRPKFGVDMTEETIPLEAGLLERAISTTKGCYVGQEVIIRVLHRGGGRVAKRLVRLAFERGQAPPEPGAALEADGREVGRVTSVAASPHADRFIGLGYVQRDLAETGGRLAVQGHGAATIAGLGG